ncbi:MAG TPA: OsmC family peroxiredoxin [Acidimicrobiales bacterium]|nr:OsmC family peroxiredoxin [Acidimicrobiales bacterium]
MATTRNARAHWEGTLLEGQGTVELTSSGIGTYPITWASRAETPDGRTSPEELLAAAHASCFSMALSNGLAKSGNTAISLNTSVEVDFQPGTGITEIRITVSGEADNLDAEGFRAAAEDAKANCPVSKALAAVPSIKLSVV